MLVNFSYSISEMNCAGSSDTCKHEWAPITSLSSIVHCNSELLSPTSSSCHLCGYESVRQSNLLRHMKTMHDVIQYQALHCCGKKFQDKAEYRNHCRLVHREGHECPTCQRRFTRRALLHRHQSVHTGFKEFKCSICPYASSHKSNLERHFKTHDPADALELGKKIRKIRSPKHQQPDSTTSGTVASHYPILRNMLKIRPSSTSVKLKSELNHSIESILNRKEVKPRRQPESLIETEFPLFPGVEEISSEMTEVVNDKTNVAQSQPMSVVGFSSIINHPLSSPFNWTTSFMTPEFRNPGSTQSPWRFQPTTTSCQDLRIYSRSDFLQPQQICWNPSLILPHVATTANYSYPYYANNGVVGPPLSK